MSRSDLRTPVRARRGFAAVVAVIAMLASLLVGFGSPDRAEAANGANFSPGLIISDALFYDGQAMTAAQIQTFLNSKIGTCTNGRCLSVAMIDYPGRARDVSARTGKLVCEAIAAGTVSAAELIYRAQVACGISAKVILVTLQKEQGLVTKTAPTDLALSHAMGMACPDTAPCDPSFAGLGRQIAAGTAQLKVYKAGAFGRQPGVQYIQWNPNSACGGTNVNVQNYATAALYNYTPYQPNSAALANMYQVGDSCSSYGNRNFWAYYSDWFGNPAAGAEGTGASAISEAWAASGGITGPWGNRMAYMTCLTGPECGHLFENVIAGWTMSSGVVLAQGQMKDWVLSEGLARTGYPDSIQVSVTENGGGIAQSFSKGLVNWGPAGPFLVSGPTRDAHALLGGVAGTSGWPISSKLCLYAGGACIQRFQNAYISEVGGVAYSVADPEVYAYYEQKGGPASLGAATSSLLSLSNGGSAGQQQAFQNGLINDGPSGVFLVSGAVRDVFGRTGGVAGALGWPVGEQLCPGAGGCSQTFQNGRVIVTPSGTAWAIANPAVAAYYQTKGGVGGSLGYPASDTIITPLGGGGVQQVFTAGLVESSSAGTFLLSGAVRDEHGRRGGVGGALGWPTSEQVCAPAGGACSQAFQNGTIVVDPAGKARAIANAAVASYYQSKGGAGGSLGYPVTDTIVTPLGGGGVQQGFTGGLVESSPAGTFLVSGAVREAHGRQGGVGGSLGWPTAEQVCVSGSCSQAFQNGTVFVNASGQGGGIANAAIASYYQSKGGLGGSLGYPLSDTIVTPLGGGGVQQVFTAGLVESSPAGTFLLAGAVREEHGRRGGVGGVLGWPTGELVCGLAGGGCSQAFQNGTIFVASNGQARAIANAAIATYFQSKGGAGGSLGYPVTDTIVTPLGGGGVQQGFTGGLVESSPAGTFLLSGVVRDEHGRRGGVGGALGWPTGELVCGLSGGGCSQDFQRGTIFVASNGAVSVVPKS